MFAVLLNKKSTILYLNRLYVQILASAHKDIKAITADKQSLLSN